MYIDRNAIRAEARSRMRGALPKPYYEGLLYILAAGALTVLSAVILTGKITPESSDAYLRLVMKGNYEAANEFFEKQLMPGGLDMFLSFVLRLFGGVVAAGLSIFAMNTLRGREASLWNLLDGFGRFFPLILLLLLMQLLTALWTQLFIIPGIIALYRYRLAVYLMLDNPQLGVFPCILFSGRLMRGYKWELFLLDLSFLGWFLLAFLPFTIASVFPGYAAPIFGGLCTGAILAWVWPYYEMSCVGFYEAVKTPIVSIPPEGPME